MSEVIEHDETCRHEEVCQNCGNDVEVMCFKGTGVCSELCRKSREAK